MLKPITPTRRNFVAGLLASSAGIALSTTLSMTVTMKSQPLSRYFPQISERKKALLIIANAQRPNAWDRVYGINLTTLKQIDGSLPGIWQKIAMECPGTVFIQNTRGIMFADCTVHDTLFGEFNIDPSQFNDRSPIFKAMSVLAPAHMTYTP